MAVSGLHHASNRIGGTESRSGSFVKEVDILSLQGTELRCSDVQLITQYVRVYRLSYPGS
jgi:hypothetical protein